MLLLLFCVNLRVVNRDCGNRPRSHCEGHTTTVGLTTATLHWLEWPQFIVRNFSLCRTWLLMWCLECAEVNTSQFLTIAYLLVLVSE